MVRTSESSSVCLVDLVSLVKFVQPKKPVRPDKPNHDLLMLAGIFIILLTSRAKAANRDLAPYNNRG